MEYVEDVGGDRGEKGVGLAESNDEVESTGRIEEGARDGDDIFAVLGGGRRNV